MSELPFESYRDGRSDKRLIAILITISLVVAAWFSWAMIRRDDVHSQCWYYALGVTHEYHMHDSFKEDAESVDTSKLLAKLPAELQDHKMGFDELLKFTFADDKKAKEAYERCLKFNR
jgi:hypothetical protein